MHIRGFLMVFCTEPEHTIPSEPILLVNPNPMVLDPIFLNMLCFGILKTNVSKLFNNAIAKFKTTICTRSTKSVPKELSTRFSVLLEMFYIVVVENKSMAYTAEFELLLSSRFMSVQTRIKTKNLRYILTFAFIFR